MHFFLSHSSLSVDITEEQLWKKLVLKLPIRFILPQSYFNYLTPMHTTVYTDKTDKFALNKIHKLFEICI